VDHILIRNSCRGRFYPDKDIGIEMELENKKSRESWPMFTRWRMEGDGSLRGNSAEYVLSNPIHVSEVAAELETFYSGFEERSIDEESLRTSTHVHLNMQEASVNEVVNTSILYWLFEEELLKYCGESRTGNLFCLSLKDAEGYLPIFESALRQYFHNNKKVEQFSYTLGDFVRYSSLNLASLSKYGTMEFRGMRGYPPIRVLKKWINTLISLRDFALTFATPMDMLSYIDNISSIEDLLNEIFGYKGRIISSVNTKTFNEKLAIFYEIVSPYKWSFDLEEIVPFTESPLTDI